MSRASVMRTASAGLRGRSRRPGPRTALHQPAPVVRAVPGLPRRTLPVAERQKRPDALALQPQAAMLPDSPDHGTRRHPPGMHRHGQAAAATRRSGQERTRTTDRPKRGRAATADRLPGMGLHTAGRRSEARDARADLPPGGNHAAKSGQEPQVSYRPFLAAAGRYPNGHFWPGTAGQSTRMATLTEPATLARSVTAVCPN